MIYKFLIYISYSYALPIGNPLEAEILRRGYILKWFSELEDGKIAIRYKNNTLETIKDAVSYRPDIVFSATNDVPDFISGIKVQIFHGFNAQKRPEKNNIFSHFRIRGFYDLYCTQGPSSTKGFLDQQTKHYHFEVIETGWPKVDPLFPIATKSRIKKKPTIMIASTFTKRLSLAYDNKVYKIINDLSLKGEYRFKMILHPKLPQEIKLKWKKLNGENFTYFDTTDIIPILKSSDVLFSDTTSVIQEFLLQKKPVVTLNHTFNHNYLLNITDANNIEDTLIIALSYPEKLLHNIENFISELHPYHDGHSSKRVLDCSIDFLHKDKSHLLAKPLNLVRKFKIRKRLNYFTFKSYNKAYTIKKVNTN